ncbi:hypothetical protein GCM10025734_29880 [Kitasatospora paranensis]
MDAGEGLLDQDDGEFGEVGEVPVEARRREPGRPGHLAHTQAAEVLVLQQAESGVEEGTAALLLLDLADPGGVTHIIQ